MRRFWVDRAGGLWYISWVAGLFETVLFWAGNGFHLKSK